METGEKQFPLILLDFAPLTQHNHKSYEILSKAVAKLDLHAGDIVQHVVESRRVKHQNTSESLQAPVDRVGTRSDTSFRDTSCLI